MRLVLNAIKGATCYSVYFSPDSILPVDAVAVRFGSTHVTINTNCRDIDFPQSNCFLKSKPTGKIELFVTPKHLMSECYLFDCSFDLFDDLSATIQTFNSLSIAGGHPCERIILQ